MLEYLRSYFYDIQYVIPIVLVSLTFHECAHGFIAYKLGDPTARSQGRLSLNPIKHLDPLGFIMMVLLHIGWAKPVPVNPMYFKNPKKGMMVTALAGPLSNLILAFISSFFLCVVVETGGVIELFGGYIPLDTASEIFYKIFMYMAILNIGLAVFNLIPVYPLDGSRILGYFMPNSFNDFFIRYGNYIYIAFFVLVLATDVVSEGISMVQYTVLDWFKLVWQTPASLVVNLFS